MGHLIGRRASPRKSIDQPILPESMSQNLVSEPVDAGLMNHQDVDLEEQHRRDDRDADDHMYQGDGQQNGGHADVAAPNSSPYLNKLELSLLFIAQGLTASLVLMYVMIIATVS